MTDTPLVAPPVTIAVTSPKKSSMLHRAFFVFVLMNGGILALVVAALWIANHFMDGKGYVFDGTILALTLFLVVMEVASFNSTLLSPLKDYVKWGDKAEEKQSQYS